MEADNPLNNTSSAPGGGLPDPSSMNLNKPKKRRGLIFGIIGAIVFVVLIIVVLAAVSINNSKVKQADLKKQYDTGFEAGKKEESQANIDAQSKDVRVYKAPSELGNFQVPIPKSWSWAVEAKSKDGTFKGTSDPDYIDLLSEFHKFNMELVRGNYQETLKEYEEDVKGGQLKGSDITVSGIRGRRYTGTVDSKTNQKVETVVVPLREKTLIFRTDDPDNYSKAFNNILAGVKLNP
jgi:hypothetical protein